MKHTEFIEKNLLSGESVIYQAEMSLYPLWFSAISFFFFLVLSGITYRAFPEDVSLWSISAFVSLFLLISAVVIWLQSYSAEYVLTDRRLILKRGLLSVKTTEIQLQKCEGISVEQSFWGSIINSGTIIVTTGGVLNRYRDIRNPILFRNRVTEQINRITGAGKAA